MLKLGFVSAWHVHFKDYLKEALNNENCSVVALWDNDAARGEEESKKIGCPFYSSYDEFLASDIDAVVVTSATNLHKELIIKAANAKKHIFTEKTLCFTEKDALEVKEAIVNNGVKFCISLPMRGMGQYKTVKKLVNDGTLGEITYARARKAHTGASDAWLPDSFYDKESCGGGAMMDLGCHGMYALLDLFGEPLSVSSVFTSHTGKAVEDNSVSILQYKSLIALSETSFVSEGSGSLIEVSGTKGTVTWNDIQNTIILCKEDDISEKITALEDSDMAFDNWITGILDDNTVIEFNIDDAVALSKVMEKAYLSYDNNDKAYY